MTTMFPHIDKKHLSERLDHLSICIESCQVDIDSWNNSEIVDKALLIRKGGKMKALNSEMKRYLEELEILKEKFPEEYLLWKIEK